MVIRIAAGEAGVAGAFVFVLPQFFASLLFGAGLTGTGVAMAELGGIGLFIVGIACWQASSHTVRALFFYNVLMAACLIYIGLALKLVGVLLWPAIAMHVILAIAVMRDRTRYAWSGT